MHAIILAVAIGCAQVSDDALLVKLDATVERLLESDTQANEVRQAACLLEGTNSNSRWTDYRAATRILRKVRSKAGIPLLLAYIVRHSELSSSHVVIPEYLETLTFLTGIEMSQPDLWGRDRKEKARDTVQRLVADWWEPQQDRISTDVNQWSDKQLAVLASRILKRGSSTVAPSTYAISQLLYQNLLQRGSNTSAFGLNELHPQMLPALLADAGYRPLPTEPPARDTSHLAYAAVDPLAELRRNGELHSLDEIADDPRQTAGTRLTCVMALFRAGEKLRTPVLLSIATEDKNLERRLVAILSLRFSGDDRVVAAALLDLVDAQNEEIRTAAVCALRGSLPPPAVAKVKRMIDSLDTPQAMSYALDVLGEYKSSEACDALAGFLAAGLEDRRKADYLRSALSAFEKATGKRWHQAGPHSISADRAKTAEALEWWKSEGRLKFR